MGVNAGFAIFQLVYIVLVLTMVGFSIYSFILFIKLARRGIKALDIFIGKNDNNITTTTTTNNDILDK